MVSGLAAEMVKPTPQKAIPYLQMLKLDKTSTPKEKVMKKLVTFALRHNKKI